MLDKLSQSSWSNRLRLIPFTSIGKKMASGRSSCRCHQGYYRKKDIEHKNMVIGIYQDRLSKEDKYQLLIPCEILDNG